MRKLYILCLVTLAAVFIDIAFLHTGTVSAQNAQVEIRQTLIFNGRANVNATGTVVGFACYPTSGGDAQCFIAFR
jgi:hypothetical protein